MRFGLVIVAALAACHPAPEVAPPQSPPPPRDPLQSIADAAAAEVVGHGTAGLEIAIARHGKIVVATGYGVADREHHVRVDADTVFRIGSLTKQFTAAAIMQLVEQGKLGLDDDIAKYVPVPTSGHVVTIRNLLNHTSGIPNYTDLPSFKDVIARRMTSAEVVALVKDTPWSFDPGTAFAYSNTGYVVLGMVIEKVSGLAYADYLAKQVYPRAGLIATRYCDNDPRPHDAHGYQGDAVAPPIDMTIPSAAGSLCSTASDLLRWTAALAAGKVVADTSFRQMISPPQLARPVAMKYGFGLVADAFKGHRQIWHNGGIPGFVSELHDFPDDGIAIAVLSNSDGDEAPQVEKTLAKAALGIAAPPLPDDVRDAVVGSYDVPTLGKTDIAIENGKLVVIPPGQPHFQLEYTGNDTFEISELGATLAFVRTNGKVTSVTLQQHGVTLEAKRLP
jgi:D-alanyl-D-alanine carboxypeptidase